jgi:hypothetical protein
MGLNAEELREIKYFKPDGTSATKEEWLAEQADDKRIIGYSVYYIKDKKITIFARYSGVDHGLDDEVVTIFELGLTGDPVEHPTLHGRHEKFATAAECLTAYNKAVTDVVAAGGKTEKEYEAKLVDG